MAFPCLMLKGLHDLDKDFIRITLKSCHLPIVPNVSSFLSPVPPTRCSAFPIMSTQVLFVLCQLRHLREPSLHPPRWEGGTAVVAPLCSHSILSLPLA